MDKLDTTYLVSYEPNNTETKLYLASKMYLPWNWTHIEKEEAVGYTLDISMYHRNIVLNMLPKLDFHNFDSAHPFIQLRYLNNSIVQSVLQSLNG